MLRSLLTTIAACLILASPALAVGGHYTIEGGTADDQAYVRQGLDRSTFNWNAVPGVVHIHILDSTATTCGYEPVAGVPAAGCATPGNIWLQSGGWKDVILGPFALRSIIAHEYAHEVDDFRLTEAERAEAQRLLGGAKWEPGSEGWTLPHEAYTGERFASMLAWTFTDGRGLAPDADSRAAVAAGATPYKFQQMLSRWGLAKAPAPICRKLKVKRGHWTWVHVHGKRVHRWVKPVYRKVCT